MLSIEAVIYRAQNSNILGRFWRWEIWNMYNNRVSVCNYAKWEKQRSMLWPQWDGNDVNPVVVDELLIHVWLFATPWTAACQTSLSITVFLSLLKLMSIESVMPSKHLILSCPLFLLLPIVPIIRVFSSESPIPIRWPKYWSFSFSTRPSNEYWGLISFRTDWYDLLAV